MLEAGRKVDMGIRGYRARAQEKEQVEQRKGIGGGCVYSGKQDPTLRGVRQLNMESHVLGESLNTGLALFLSKTVNRVCVLIHTCN